MKLVEESSRQQPSFGVWRLPTVRFGWLCPGLGWRVFCVVWAGLLGFWYQ